MRSLLIRWWREITIAILICAVGFLATRKDKIKIETVVEVKEKIVVKVEERVVYKDKVQVKTRTIVKTKEGETRVEERTESQERAVDSGIRREQEKTVDSSRKESMVVESAPERYVLGIGGSIDGSTYTGSFLVRPFPSVPVSVGPLVILKDSKFSLGIGIGVSL